MDSLEETWEEEKKEKEERIEEEMVEEEKEKAEVGVKEDIEEGCVKVVCNFQPLFTAIDRPLVHIRLAPRLLTPALNRIIYTG